MQCTSERGALPQSLIGLGNHMTRGRFTLDQAFNRVKGQYEILKYLYEINPDHVLEVPADKVVLDIVRAASQHIPGSDPMAESLSFYITIGQDSAPTFKVSQLLPLMTA